MEFPVLVQKPDGKKVSPSPLGKLLTQSIKTGNVLKLSMRNLLTYQSQIYSLTVSNEFFCHVTVRHVHRQGEAVPTFPDDTKILHVNKSLSRFLDFWKH